MYTEQKITFDQSSEGETVATLSLIAKTFPGPAGTGARVALNQHVSPIVRDCLNSFLRNQEQARRENAETCQHLTGYWIDFEQGSFRCFECGYQTNVYDLPPNPKREIERWEGD